MRKEIGGFEILDGVVLGPLFFSQNGQESSALMCPPIWAFNYGITRALNRLGSIELSPHDFQSSFNSLMDDLVADTLIYLENRLKLIVVRDKLKYKMNSVPECIKAYRILANIELENLCDINFLKNIDRVRGEKHHTHRRYDNNYTIGGVEYNTINKLRELTSHVREEMQKLDQHLSVTNKDYDIKIQRLPAAIMAEWTAMNHAFDMTEKAKIVPRQETSGLNPKNIKYFAIQMNYANK